jgi:16S rRNA (cytosine1407-C5)-methyltransferase
MAGSLEPLPELFLDRLREIVPAEQWEMCLESFSQASPAAFRVNTLQATVTEVTGELTLQGLRLTPVQWLESAFTVTPDQRRSLIESSAAKEGRIYIQNLSSMVPPMMLGPKPGEQVLDLTAAPGGKTVQMAAMMENEGSIAAVEVIRARMFKLQATLRRCGVKNTRTFLADGRTVGRKTPERFDRVLLDAPCSSESRFDCHQPKTWRNWGLRKIRECSRKQKGLLRSAVACLKPSGSIVYCTCSFAPEENEQVVHSVIVQFGEALEIQPMELPFANVQRGLVRWSGADLHPDLARSLRILPGEGMDGFYLCRLIKRESTFVRGARFTRRRRRAGRG